MMGGMAPGSCRQPCYFATGPVSKCRCPCGGESHGKGNGQALGKAPPADDEASASHSLGVTPYRGAPRSTAEATEGYYGSSRAKGFERTMDEQAKADGVSVTSVEQAPGMWEGTFEPSYVVSVDGPPSRVRSFAGNMGARYNQDAVMTFRADPGGPDVVWSTPCSNAQEGMAALESSGVQGGRIAGGDLEIADPGGGQMAQAQAVAASLGGPLQSQRGHVEFVDRDSYAVKLPSGS